MTGSRAALFAPLSLLLLVAGCRGCPSPLPPIHIVPNMDFQEKAQALEESDFFYDGMVMRLPVEGTVARGDLERDPRVATGAEPSGRHLASSPIPVDETLLARGEERYAIYCQPCHDPRGNGRGILFEYGSVPTASFHDEQRRAYTDGRLFDIITNGSGLMPGYKWPIPPEDRWAIVAHVRRLQQERVAAESVATAP
jgi:mono/diheme cytochrome c family protein